MNNNNHANAMFSYIKVFLEYNCIGFVGSYVENIIEM